MTSEAESGSRDELVRLQDERDQARSQLLHLSRVVQQNQQSERDGAPEGDDASRVIADVEERQRQLLHMLQRRLEVETKPPSRHRTRDARQADALPDGILQTIQTLHERLRRLDDEGEYGSYSENTMTQAYEDYSTTHQIRGTYQERPSTGASIAGRMPLATDSGLYGFTEKEGDLFKFELERLRMDNKSLTQENSSYRRQISELKEELRYLQSLVKQKMDDIQDLNIQISKVKLELEKNDMNYSTQQKSYAGTPNEMELNDRIRELTRSKEKVEADYRNLRAEFNTFLEERRKHVEIEKKLFEADSLLETRTNELMNLQLENKRLFQELSNLREKGKVELELEATRSRAGQMRRDLLSTEKELQLHSNLLEDTKRELAEARRKIKELDSKYQSEMRRNEDLEIKIDNVSTELRYEKQKASNLEVELHTTSQKLEIMSRRQETEQKRADQLMNGMDKFEQQVRDRNKVISSLQEEIFNLQVALEESNKVAQGTVHNPDEAVTARDELELVLNELHNTREKLKTTEDQLTRASRMVKKLESGLESQSQRVLEERSLNAKQQEEIKQLQAVLQTTKTSLDEAKRSGMQVNAYQNSMHELSGQFELCKRELRGTSEKLYEVTARNEQLNAKLRQYEEEMSKQSYVLADRDLKLQSLQAEFERVKARAERESGLRQRQAQEFEQDRVRLQQLIQHLNTK